MKADAFRYDGKRALVVGGATGMGAATAELVQDLGAEVVVMDYAPVTLDGVKAINARPPRQGQHRRRLDECGGPIDALFSCAGVADGTPGHREDQLHRPPAPHRPGDREGLPRPRQRDRHDLLDRRPRVAHQHGRRSRSTSPPPTSTPPSPGSRPTPNKADYMLGKQAINVYVASQAFPMLQQRHPHQRDPARPDRHAARAGQRRDVARLRHRLPRRDRHRGVASRRAGRSAGVPLQRRRVAT